VGERGGSALDRARPGGAAAAGRASAGAATNRGDAESALDRAGLIYGLSGPAGATSAAVVLQGTASDVERLTALAGTVAPARALVVPDPLRFLYLSRSHVGRRWFVRSIDGETEPATFGDALYAVEQLTLGAGERWDEPPLLLGHGQGGELALALAAIVPELLAGVVALDAVLPVVPGWERPACDAGGLPVLVLPGAQEPAAVERTRAELAAVGARVTVAPSHGEAAALGAALDEPLASWWAAEGPDGPPRSG
jgi:pimeloyl-ACP methyl ester carboxylesterase